MTDYLATAFRFGGATTVTVADSSTPTQVASDAAKSRLITCSGTLTATRTIVLVTQPGWDWTIQNTTDQTIAVAAQLGGTTVNVVAGGVATVVATLAGFIFGSGFVPGGTTSQVLLGDGTAENVPAAALPAPAASTRGGVALPASATGTFLRDDGTFAAPAQLATRTGTITVPAANAVTSSLAFDTTSGLRANEVYVAIDNGGQRMTCTATSMADSTHVVLTAWGAVGDVAATTVLASPVKLYPIGGRVVLTPTASLTIPNGNVDVLVAFGVLGAAATVTMPATLSIWQTIAVLQGTNANTYNVSLALNGNKLNGPATTTLPTALSTAKAAGVTTVGWTFTAISANELVM